LFDDAVLDSESGAEPQTEPETIGRGGGVVACVAGRNELDEAAAMLLSSVLQARGHRSYVVQADAVNALSGHPMALREAGILCLSLISTSSPARARHIVRRLRRRAPRARIIIGFWGLDAAEHPPADILPITSADAIATTLAAAIAEIETQTAALAPLPTAAAG
jgi:hypothetical protein